MTIGGVGYVASLALALVFAVSASSKLRDHAAVAREFQRLGVRRADVVAQLLPIVEIGIAVLLVVVPWFGSACGLAMLSAFSVVLVRQYRSGVAAGCSCFGAVADQMIGRADFLRNGLLALLAMVGVGAERARPVLAEVMVTVIAVGLGWLAVRIVRQSGSDRGRG